MYQFSTTNVINSAYALDYNGTILVDGTGSNVPKYAGTSTAFTVAKVHTFKKPNIVSVHKRPYAAGVLETATATIGTAATAGDVLRFTVEIKLSQTTQSEYTNYGLDFKKPVVIEILSAGVAATDATAIKNQLNLLKDRFGHTYFNASSSGNVITLVAKESTQRFSVIDLSKITANSNSITTYDAIPLAGFTTAVTVPGAMGFGDDNWMQRSIMLQTLENTRYFGISKDERPILGGNYTEYVLRYAVLKDGQDGIVSGATSITTHVFYVLSTLQAAFEAALVTTFPTILSTNGLVFVGSQTIAATTVFTVNGANPGETVNFTSSATGVATVTASAVASAAGIATFTVTKVAAGNTNITATAVTSGRTAVIGITVS